MRRSHRGSRPRPASPHSLLTLIALLALAGSLLLVAACGDENGSTSDGATTSPPAAETTTPDASASPTPAGETTFLVYFLRGEKLGTAQRAVPRTVAVARAAMEALCGGPTDAEKAAGLLTAVPDGSAVRGISIEGTTATVDLSGEFESGGGSLSMRARVAQVVYTLTQFPTIRAVELMLDGEPVQAIGGEGVIVEEPQRRADWDEFEPPIFVERPGVGATLSSPFVVQGRATAFEATVAIDLLDENEEAVVETFATATEGAPGRGSFRKAIRFTIDSDSGWLAVYESSMEDGSRLNEVRVPVTFDQQ
jgi:hypothetical protein